MAEDNKRNVHYFEAASMQKLFDVLDTWQRSTNQRLLSVNVAQDAGAFCCIALTNPTEVIIVDGEPYGGARVQKIGLFHRLHVSQG